MGYTLKGFCNINDSYDRVTGNTSGLGELSPLSRTYSTNKTNLADPSSSDVSIVVFSSTLDTVPVAVPVGLDVDTLAVLNDYTLNAVPGSNFADQLSSRNNNLQNITAGPAVVYEGKTLPAWLKWSVSHLGISCDITIWFSDVNFQSEYDEHEIRVVPPVPNVLDLKENATHLRGVLDAHDFSAQMSSVESAKGNDPYTSMETMKLKWIDPSTNESFLLTWVLICYGVKAADPQVQLDAIREYLLTTTGLTPDYWQDRVPDIIIRDTITIIPLWDNVAIRSSGDVDYEYSPTIGVGDILNVLTVRYPANATDYVANAAFSMAHYKSLCFVAIPDGPGSNTPFNVLYPDYAVIPLNDANLGRLSAMTRDAIVGIEYAVRLAETYDGTQDLPLTVTELNDGRLVYLTYIVNGASHRVVTRKSYRGVTNSVTTN